MASKGGGFGLSRSVFPSFGLRRMTKVAENSVDTGADADGKEDEGATFGGGGGEVDLGGDKEVARTRMPIRAHLCIHPRATI